jgi:preprotein translocase subunit SecA
VSKISLWIENMKKKLKYPDVEFDLTAYREWLNKVNSYDFSGLDDAGLMGISNDIKQKITDEQSIHAHLPEAYALVKEAAWRKLGLRVHDEQILAAIGLHIGRIVEMKTGEGKTLAAVFPAFLNALTGKGVHILTFNDYLAKRDALWMSYVYKALGLSVGYIKDGMPAEKRKTAYGCDVTYMTAKEAGFDYLREFLGMEPSQLIQRPFHFAIVDEADSILIDEARIPMVLAGVTGSRVSDVLRMAEIVEQLTPNEDFELDEYERNVFLTEAGLSKVEAALQCDNLYNGKNNNLLADLNNALHARALLKKDIDYIVRDGKVELVDEFTGRVADKRHWPHGLHEAVEAREGISAKQEGRILASITLQNFIHLYPKVSGMTGTALSAAEEFFECYQLKVMIIPPHKPCIRQDLPDVVYTHREAKRKGLIEEITRVHRTGRPILIGTASIEESEVLATDLKEAGIPCQVLNAKNDEAEARIIENAGALYSVTVSTNMAGRGTDIRLGGAGEEDREKVMSLGGLYVIGTNRHESRRIDDQFRGRSGRQGDPGTSRFFISLEDDLMLRYNLKDLIPKSLYPKRQDKPLDNPIINREIASAQRIIEGQNFDMRKNLNKYWTITEHQRQIIWRQRMDILLDRVKTDFLLKQLPKKYNMLLPVAGAEALAKAEKEVVLYMINRCWMDYLDYLSYIRESIHLVNFAKEVPIFEYNKRVVAAFEQFGADLREEIIKTLAEVKITKDGVNLDEEGLAAPGATWTYLVDDKPLENNIQTVLLNPMAMIFNFPIYLIMLLYHSITKGKGSKEKRKSE